MKVAFATALKRNKVLLAASIVMVALSTWSWLQDGNLIAVVPAFVILILAVATVLREVDRVRGLDDFLIGPSGRNRPWIIAIVAIMALSVVTEVGALILALADPSFSPLPLVRVCVAIGIVPLIAYIVAWCVLRLPREA